MTFTLQFERRFSMAHRLLSGHSSKCAIPHGHNEFVRISLMSLENAPLNHNDNMVTDFASAKSKWHQFIDEQLDHSFQVRNDDPLIQYFLTNEPHQIKRLVITPGDPTTEMLCACLMSKLDHILIAQQSTLRCEQIALEETPTNTVILSGQKAYAPHLPQGNHWWNRGDLTINDLACVDR